MALFTRGQFVLHHGHPTTWKIDCDALTDEDIHTLAGLLATLVGPFRSVKGIPQGGMRLAQALLPLANPWSGVHVIVDDVLTTGGSMERARDAYVKLRTPEETCLVKGAVLFARGPCPDWIKPLFDLHHYLWTKEDPTCR